MIIGSRVVGPVDVNVYLIGDEHAKEAAIVDPAGDVEGLVRWLESHRLNLRAILATCGHDTHIEAAPALSELTGAPIVVLEAEAPSLSFAPEATLRDGDVVRIGSIDIHAIATPGHSIGGASYYVAGSPGYVLTGDVLFREKIGRHDHEESDLPTLIRMVKERLFELPEETIVLPGHGASTTIAHEREHNPFLNPGARRN